MASNPIKGTDIAAKGVTNDLQKDLKDARKEVDELNKSLIELGKTQKKNIEQEKKKPDTIKKAKEVNKAAKKADETAKAINKTRVASEKIQKQLLATEVKIIAAKTKEAKEVAALNIEAKKQNDLNKEAAILNQKNLGTLERISVRNKQLIRERKGLNLESDKGKKRLREINAELDKNNKKVKDNVSNLEKQKINVGNYSDSIKEAAGASGLFGGILGRLAAIQGTINALTKKNVAASKADAAIKSRQAAATAQLTVAQRASAIATGIGTKAMKVFKIAVASTGVGLLAVALGGLIAFFTRSQKGIDFLSVKMAQMGAVVDVIIDAFAAFGETIFEVFSKPEEIIESLIGFIKSIPQLVLDNIVNRFLAFGEILSAIVDGDLQRIADGFIQLGTGVEDFSQKASGAIDAVKESAEAAVESTKELAAVMAEKARISGILKELTIDLAREEALFTAQQAATITEIKKLVLISKDKLKLDEVRIQALKDANALEISLGKRQLELAEEALAASLDGLSADEKSLKNDAERLQFINDIKDGKVTTAEAIQKAADFTLSSAKGEEALFEIVQKIEAIEQQRQSNIQLQIKTTRQLSALQVQVATKDAMALVRRAAALRQLAKNEEESIKERTLLLQLAAVKEIESFELQVKANIKNADELAAAKLGIEAKLKADIKKLSEKDEKIEQKRLVELEALRQEELDGQIAHQERLLDNEKLTVSQRVEIIEEIFRLRKEAIEKAAEFELKSDELTKEGRELIKKEEVNALNALEHERVTAVEDANEAILDSDEDTGKKRLEEAKKTGQKVVKEFLSELNQINKAKVDALNTEVSDAEDSVKEQERIAAAGGEAIVGEEKARLAKLRLERKRELEEQALLERRIALAQNFVNALASYSKEDPKTAFAKASFETFAGQAFAKVIAGFEEGGYTGDGGTSDVAGVVHGKEFVIDAPTTAKLGLKGANMVDFNNRLDSNSLMSPSHFKQLEISQMMQPSNVNIMPMITKLGEQTDRLERAFKQGQVKYSVDWNSQSEAIERETKAHITKVTRFKKGRL